MSDDTVTVSAKVSKQLRDKIDEIGKKIGISNRSVLVRKALESFVEGRVFSGIPTIESSTTERGSARIAIEEILGIPQQQAILAEEEGGEESKDAFED